MILHEILDTKLAPQAFKSAGDDQAAPTLSSIRKNRLTLLQINKLRMINDIRRWEEKERLSKVRDQYTAAAAAEPAM